MEELPEICGLFPALQILLQNLPQPNRVRILPGLFPDSLQAFREGLILQVPLFLELLLLQLLQQVLLLQQDIPFPKFFGLLGDFLQKKWIGLLLVWFWLTAGFLNCLIFLLSALRIGSYPGAF